MSVVLGLWVSGVASAGDFRALWQGEIQGGVSVDTSGVAVPSGTLDNQVAFGPDLVLEMPANARVVAAYAIVTAKGGGFRPNVANSVRINGALLSKGVYLGELANPYNKVQMYELPRTFFHIDGAGEYSYIEHGRAEKTTEFGLGISGTTLVAVYEDLTLPTWRHVSVFGTQIVNGLELLDGLPYDGYAGDAVLSLGIGFEPWFDQANDIYVDESLVTLYAGGADDGDYAEGYTRPLTNWDSQITGGSFGVDATDVVVGTEGDDPDLEPVGGNDNNSRKSDELYRVPYTGEGDLLLELRNPMSNGNDQWITSVVVSMDLLP